MRSRRRRPGVTWMKTKRARRAMRRSAERLRNTGEILEFCWDSRLSVQELTPYQFRVAGWLDLYPTNQRYHNLRTNRRGWYEDLAALWRKLQEEQSHDGAGASDVRHRLRSSDGH